MKQHTGTTLHEDQNEHKYVSRQQRRINHSIDEQTDRKNWSKYNISIYDLKIFGGIVIEFCLYIIKFWNNKKS